MVEKKMDELTKKAINKSHQMTQSALLQSQKMRHPSKKVDKIGTTIGTMIGESLVCIGVIQCVMGKSLWAIGTLLAGSITILSNYIHHYKQK
ncbi:hypothetical protein, partial [Candidatus Stoquefichus massiliensis]|uniref:hypothetical protein n=1 Tax=Candidatus Stoquefichus massiliensis TaxID=1470350 RepID=UPI0004B31C68